MSSLNPLEAMQAMSAMQQQGADNPLAAIAAIAEVPALLVRIAEAVERNNELLASIDGSTSKAGAAIDELSNKSAFSMLTGR